MDADRLGLSGRTKAGFRLVLALILTVLLATVLTPVNAQAGRYNEAPQLAERVAAGELPPVEERLPEEPMVVEPHEQLGNYGGTWRHWLLGSSLVELYRSFAWEHLVQWDAEFTTAVPNVAESFVVNENATEYTFRLREGMKWSDGHPYTADDIMFWYEDVFMNQELTPAQGRNPPTVEKLDDHTVKVSFAQPNGLFLYQLAAPGGRLFTGLPHHYLEQFHAKYNPEGIDALVREAGADDWANLFDLKAGLAMPFQTLFQNPKRPSLHAWLLNNAFGEGTQIVVTRNPYYWKVDSQGNQLPYIDRIVYDIFQDEEVMLLRALGGELHLVFRFINNSQNKPLLIDHAERGNYRLFNFNKPVSSDLAISLNLNHKDPVMREIFNNKDFRIGLSHAIDRQEIVDLVYVEQALPQQTAPPPGSAVYNERLATQYLEYDVDLANEHLDSAGYAERDAEGFRLGPDGNRISFVVEVGTDGLNWVDAMELVSRDWRAVGIDAQIRQPAQALFTTRLDANEHDAVVWRGGGASLIQLLLTPDQFVPVGGAARYGRAWASWYSGGTTPAPEEPPVEIQRQMALYDQLRSTADPDRQVELLKQILDIAADHLYTIGIAIETAQPYGIVKNNFHNVPDGLLYEAWESGMVIPAHPGTFFIGE